MQGDRQHRPRFAEIDTLFADIDDTISTCGRITSEAYAALWEAAESGLRIVPVTGRPAGWCDHIARMWPVAAVIGENGGFYFCRNARGLRRVYAQDRATRERNRQRLDRIRDEILDTFPELGIAADQPYRELDLAIDYAEDVPGQSLDTAGRVVAIFERHGAVARISSIHVNGWFGEFNKLSMTERYVRDVDGLELGASLGRYAFIGDSANDEPMFAFFSASIGVANVRRFLPLMNHAPAWVTPGEAGAGFVEAVQFLLERRKEPGCFPKQGTR